MLRESAAAKSVSRVVFASSREVYGEPIELPVDEGQPLLAINFYGASKVVGEAYCRAFRRASGLNTVILRIANAYGPRDYGRVIPLWVDQARAVIDLQVYGGKQVLDFVWVGQVVEALMRAADLEGPLPPINVGSGTGTSSSIWPAAFDCMAAVTRRSSSCRAAVEVVQFVARIDRMRQLLRLEPPSDPLFNLHELVPTPGRGSVALSGRTNAARPVRRHCRRRWRPGRPGWAATRLSRPWPTALGADLLDSSRRPGVTAFGRLVARLPGHRHRPGRAGVSARGQYDVILTDGEHIGFRWRCC